MAVITFTTLFAVLGDPGNQALATSISAHFPEDYVLIRPGQWLIVSTGTAKGLSDKLGVTPGNEIGAAAIFATAGYYGRAGTQIWEWIAAKWGNLRMRKGLPKDSDNAPPTSPSRYAETPPPPSYTSGDYSYTVELVGNIQNQLGRLMQAIETLTKDSSDMRKKLDRLSHIIYAAGVVGTILVIVFGFAANKIADAVIATMKSSAH